jgi:RNA polymerase sigma-70 factor (ECF subfamily)
MGAGETTPTDTELLKRVAGGDVSAVAELYDRHAGILLALALRVLRNRSEAEDVVHDAFVVVGERAGQYVPERGAVGAWLVTLVRNLSIDRTRRRERRGALARDVLAYDAEAQGAYPPADPEAQVAGAAERDRVRRALASLPEAQRATLETAFYGGLTYTEIAAREGVPLGTVKSRAARAMAALRAALGEDR